jgi:predicted RNA-binding Zn ribbon-like protein
MSVMGAAAEPRVTFSRIGGHVALDLLNTVEWRLDPELTIEDLTTYGQVLEWARQTELINQREHRVLSRLAPERPQQADAELVAFRRLRETAYAALVEHEIDAVEEVVAQHRAALARAVLRPVGDRWAWAEPALALTTPRDRAVRAVVDLLTSPDLATLHQCEDAACGWVYLDTSPRRNRRWCVAADCGNRNRARRFYARQKEKAIQTPVES